MKILSINVGMPREVAWRGETVLTSIFKAPIAGLVAVTTLNLAGDRQADLTVHGGARKAVYVYPFEHYAFWREQLPGVALDWGSFGENLTTEGVLETEVAAGDTFEIGTAAFQVTIPRMPCYKLQVRFNRLDIVKRFWRSRRCGFYLSVLREGEIAPGAEIRMIRGDRRPQSIADVFASRDAG